MPDLSPRAYDDNSPFYTPPTERESAPPEIAREAAKEPVKEAGGGKKPVGHGLRAQDLPAAAPQVMSIARTQRGSRIWGTGGGVQMVYKVLQAQTRLPGRTSAAGMKHTTKEET